MRASTVERGNVRALPLPVAARFSRFTAARTAAPLMQSSFATSPGVNESPAGSSAGAPSRRRAFSQSAAFPASASSKNTNPHPESIAAMRPVVRAM